MAEQTNDSFPEKFLIAILSASIAIAGTITGSYFTQRWQIEGQMELQDRGRRHQLFSEIMGLKTTLNQLSSSTEEAKIYHRYHEARWVMRGEDIDLVEARRHLQRAETLIIELTKARERFYQLVGSVWVLFPQTAELTQVINGLGQIGITASFSVPEVKTVGDLESWKNTQVEQSRISIENNFGKRIDRLINHLTKELTKS